MKLRALIIAIITIFTVNNASAQHIGWQWGADFGGVCGKTNALHCSAYGGISFSDMINLDVGIGLNAVTSTDTERSYSTGVPIYLRSTFYLIRERRLMPNISLSIGPNINSKHTGIYFNGSVGATFYTSGFLTFNLNLGYSLFNAPYSETKKIDFTKTSIEGVDLIGGFYIGFGISFCTEKYY